MGRRLRGAGFEVGAPLSHHRPLADFEHDTNLADDCDGWELCPLQLACEFDHETAQLPLDEEPRNVLSEWVLLENWGGHSSMPSSPVPSLAGSGSVISRWLTDGSNTELSSIQSESTPAEASPTNFVMKIATWAHPCDEPSAIAPEVVANQGLQKKFRDIQKALTSCEQQLVALERDETPTVAMPECSKLCGELVTLAAGALECGCSREVPGAMDAFEQANAAVERVAELLKRDDHVSEKRVSTSAIEDNIFLSCLAGVINIFEDLLTSKVP